MAKVIFFPNGNTVFLNMQGEQVSEIQERGWLKEQLSLFEKHGYNPAVMHITLPDGKIAIPFKTKNGWNWKIK
jgi:hypothetical protein